MTPSESDPESFWARTVVALFCLVRDWRRGTGRGSVSSETVMAVLEDWRAAAGPLSDRFGSGTGGNEVGTREDGGKGDVKPVVGILCGVITKSNQAGFKYLEAVSLYNKFKPVVAHLVGVLPQTLFPNSSNNCSNGRACWTHFGSLVMRDSDVQGMKDRWGIDMKDGWRRDTANSIYSALQKSLLLLHIVAQLTKHQCNAQLSILVPIDEHDLHAVIISAAGIPHTHPSFPHTKIPSAIKQKYQQCIDATGGVGATMLQIDKSSSTLSILDGKLPQELHPGMIISWKRCDMVKETCQASFPDGTGLPVFYLEFNKEQSRDINERYIHFVTTCLDGMHIIIIINPELAVLTLDAIWIMVDTTFVVVHGKTNEWKLVIWLNYIDKHQYSVCLSHCSQRNWYSEGAKAQGLADVIICRGMNPLTVGEVVTTCIVHFNRILMRSARGVFGLKVYISESDLEYLLGFPYLCSDEEIQAYYTFCVDSTIAKVQNKSNNSVPGSHAQDNQVNSTRRPLLEAIILNRANKLDSDTAQVIKATMVSGVLENPHNSLETRYKSQSQRKARGQEKQLELQSLTGREAKKLRDRARSGEEQAKANELEIIRLCQQIDTLTHGANLQPATPPRQPVAGPSRLNYCRLSATTPENYMDVDDYFVPRMQSLQLFPGLRPRTPIADPRSDFDYQGAFLDLDILDTTLERIVDDHPMYPVDGDDDILASDPYTIK
ncbi:hypothetical protein C8R43DRAFT_944208 [Mycena crocata]|nr:hypothetical protein C8R43DRAFT_944208 [Mycena crocata]